jgi:hypothetical protein
MTAEQLAKLCPLGKRGQELKPLLPKLNARQRIGSYSHTLKALQTLLKQNVIKRDRHHNNEPYFFFLSNERFSDNFFNKHHERACADIYVAYKTTGLMEGWDDNWKDHTKEYGLKFNLRYDRRMRYKGQTFYWELDRGQEDLETIEGKVKKYQKFLNETQHIFFIIFVVESTRYKTIEERCEDITNVIASQNTKGFQFLVARHADVIENPLGSVFLPVNAPDQFISLDQLS